MFFYIAMLLWAITLVNAYHQGAIKLAFFTLISGAIVIWLVYFRDLGVIGQTILCFIALVSYFGGKLISLKSSP